VRAPRTWFSQRHSLRAEILTVVAIYLVYEVSRGIAPANHFLFDALAGGVVAVIAALVAWWIARGAPRGRPGPRARAAKCDGAAVRA